MDEALSMASSPHDFKLMAASGGQSSSSLENVNQQSDQVPAF